MDWRSELKQAVEQENDSITRAKDAEQKRETQEREQRQAARALFQAEILLGLRAVAQELEDDPQRRLTIIEQLENVDPRVQVHIGRPNADDMSFWIIAEVSPTDFRVVVRERPDYKGPAPFAFPTTRDALTRDNVAAAVGKAYLETLKRK